jgi:oligosaccharide repeat unit polymerase
MAYKIKGSMVFSPYTFLIIFWVIYTLASFPNRLGWGERYGVNIHDHFLKYLLYTIFFILGILIADLIYKNKISSNMIISMNLTNFRIILLFSFFFMLMKFVNVQDIPLIGNSMSRYKYSLGGFSDYPSRFLPVISILCFWRYIYTAKKSYLYFTFLALLLPLLFLQRQDVMVGVLGIVITQSFQKSFSVKFFLKYLFFIIGLFLIIIGGGVIVRYGVDDLSSNLFSVNLPIFELAITAAHGDITLGSILGAYVTEAIDDFYYGLYSLGEYASVLNLSDFDHGAALIQKEFTDRETAQSVAIPFSYYIDFSYYGIIIFSFLSGFLLKFLQLIANQNILYTILYALFLINLLWSLRSGILPFNPIFIYQFLLLSFIFTKKTFGYTYILTPIVFFMFSLSFLFMLIRF